MEEKTLEIQNHIWWMFCYKLYLKTGATTYNLTGSRSTEMNYKHGGNINENLMVLMVYFLQKSLICLTFMFVNMNTRLYIF